MRSIVCTIAFLSLSSIIFAQSDAASKLDRDVELSEANYCPRTHALDGVPEEEYWLEGTIGKSTARMYIHRAGSDVVGLFYTTDGDWTPTFLGGEWNAKGINLLGESANEDPTGRLEIQLVNGAFVVEDGVPAFDSDGIAAKARIEARRLWNRMEEEKR